MHPDHRPYLKFTSRSRLEKSVNSLLGLVEGIAIDGSIDALDQFTAATVAYASTDTVLLTEDLGDLKVVKSVPDRPNTFRAQTPQSFRFATIRHAYDLAAADPDLADALRLNVAVPVQQLPGFAQGLVSVQDAAAQLAAPLLLQALQTRKPQDGLRLLDACAAPGGKTAQVQLVRRPGVRERVVDMRNGRGEIEFLYGIG